MLADISVVASDQNNMAPELDKLIAAANSEMNGYFNNEQEDGTFRKTNKFHMEAYKNSCAYVAVFIKSYVDNIDTAEELKNKQLDIFRYVKPNPEFQKLLDYLIEHNLPLYQYFITRDCKYKTPVAI